MKVEKKPNHRFQDALRQAARLHDRGAGGVRVALRLTAILDRQIQASYKDLRHNAKAALAVVALGGYGRKELCFASDTDIMFLVPENDAEAGFAVQKLLHHLLDLGLDIGHSVRTVQDCLELRKADLEAWVSLVESRFLCGNRALFSEFRKGLQQQINGGDRSELVRILLDRVAERHRKHGSSSRLLEPNIKNSAGGLRDLHAVLWLALASGSLRLPARIPEQHTAIRWLLQTSFFKRHFPPHLRREALQAHDMLLRTRNTMHLLSKGLHDSLEFMFQRSVAESLHYRTGKRRSSVEHFMQEQFVAMRAVTHCARRAYGFYQRKYSAAASPPPVSVSPRFFARNGLLYLRGRSLTNDLLLEASLHRCKQGIPFSDELWDRITRGLVSMKPLKGASQGTAFRSLLQQDRNVAAVLQELNDHGVLERWIPEWRAMVAFFQHNQYHFYTADEHTLRVLEHAESLAADSSPLGEAFRSLPQKDLLYFACLFHDIGKPHRVGDHEITGAGLARKILRRLGTSDLLKTVPFLVRHHLSMEQIAFRRNLSDPQTIIDFASRFESPLMLDYLYVLTFADLKAVNKNVWTEWKGMLLFELYRKTREVLERKLSDSEVHEAARTRHSQAVQDLVQTLADAIPPESSRHHLDAVDGPAYVAAFNSDEIREHIQRIGKNETVATIFRRHPTMTEVTIIARDAPGALSQFCGVLSANDANIIDAQIFTRNDGIIIDKFRVTDFISHRSLGDDQCEKIHAELNDVLAGTVDIEHLLRRHRMKWRRLTHLHGGRAPLAVKFGEHPRYTIIDIYAPDRLGFLHKITSAMSLLDLNITFAKIATRADGIVDSFYVVGADGRPLSSERKESVRTALLETLGILSNTELVPQSP